MASTYEVDFKRKDILTIYPEDLIVNDKDRGRHFPPTKEQIEALAKDIEEKGQLQPVSVTVTHDRKLRLIAGRTRYEAIRLLNSRNDEANRRRVECKVANVNDEEAFLIAISENRQRNVTTVIDDAHNIRRLSEHFHKDDDEILTIYGDNGKPKSQAWLDQMRKLLTLSNEQQRAIHEGHLGASTGYLLADMSPDNREVVFEEIKHKTEKGEKVSTSQALKVARQNGALDKVVSLKMTELKSSLNALKENSKSPRVYALCDAMLEYIQGELTEPDFFGVVKELVK